MKNGANPLNSTQLEAAHHLSGPCVVWAGPGTGKTRILEERTVWLIEEKGYLPQNIGLLTFTNKVEGEILGRLSARLSTDVADSILVRNLHSLALMIITTEKKLKKARVPEVIDQTDAFALVKRAMSETGLDEGYHSPIAVWDLIGKWKTGGRKPENLEPVMRRLVTTYQQILEAEGKWDLSDLIVKAVKALQTNEAIRNALAINIMMVDEWQDTALSEYHFLKCLLNGNQNLMVVGAPAQSIYSWRGANTNKLDELFRQDFPDAQEYRLSVGYRNGKNIITASASMVKDSPEVWLDSDQHPGNVCIVDSSTDLMEAEMIASEISALSSQHDIEPDDFAVLFRSWSQVSRIEKALVDHQLPYVLFGNTLPFYERREVRELLAYLRLVLAMCGEVEVDDLDGALDQILNVPARGIGPASIKAIRGSNPQIGWAEFNAALVNDHLRDQVKVALKELFELLTRLSHKADVLLPSEMISAIIRETGWDRWLEEELEGKKVLKNLQTMWGEAQAYTSLKDFVDNVLSKIRSDINGSGIALSTIHAAKGLEWEVVFVAGMNEGLLPHAKALELEADPQEERNLTHVAFSRAKHVLIVSWFRDRERLDGRNIKQRPSRYLSMIPKEVLHEYSAGNSGFGAIDGIRPAGFSEKEETFETLFG